MSYHSTATDSLFGFSHDLDEAKLRRAIAEKADVDFIERSSPGFAYVIGHMRWRAEGQEVEFEGLTGKHTLTDPDVDRVIAHWAGFTDAQKAPHEAQIAALRDAR